MVDREKVIKGLECCLNGPMECEECPYMAEDGATVPNCVKTLRTDALSLLKAKEPKTVIVDDMPKDESWFGIWFGRCPECNEMLAKKYHKHFCGNCGQAVKWYE